MNKGVLTDKVPLKAVQELYCYLVGRGKVFDPILESPLLRQSVCHVPFLSHVASRYLLYSIYEIQ